MSDEKSINLAINDGDAFYANEVSLNFSPTNIFLDFKFVTPRIDARSQSGPTFALKHNVVVLDPYTVQQFAHLLSEVIQKYEGEFGQIKKPKQIEIAEKKQTQPTKKTTTDVGAPIYFG